MEADIRAKWRGQRIERTDRKERGSSFFRRERAAQQLMDRSIQKEYKGEISELIIVTWATVYESEDCNEHCDTVYMLLSDCFAIVL